MKAFIHLLHQEHFWLRMVLITIACLKSCSGDFQNHRIIRYDYSSRHIQFVLYTWAIVNFMINKIFVYRSKSRHIWFGWFYIIEFSKKDVGFFLALVTGFEENFQVCQDKYSSWGNCRGWTALLCMCSFESRRCSYTTYWAHFALCYILFKRNAGHRIWRKRKFWCLYFNQGISVVNCFCYITAPMFLLLKLNFYISRKNPHFLQLWKQHLIINWK